MIRLRMQLNANFSGPQAWLLLAIQRGYVAAAGVELELTQGTGAYNAAPKLVEGEFDLAYGDLCSLIEVAVAEPARAPVGVLATFNASPGAIAVRPDGPVRGPADLRGKRLIGHASDVALRSFGAFAAATGIDPADVMVERVEGSMSALVARVRSGEVDGLFGYVSTMAAALAAEGLRFEQALRFLRYDRLVPDLYGSAVMVAPRWLTAPWLPGLVAALHRGLVEAVADPKAGIEAVMGFAPDAEPGVELLRWVTTIAIEMGHPDGKSGHGDVDPARFARFVALHARTAGLAFTPATEAIFTPAFLPRAGA